jgi:SAM-dependent methyltransferase
LNPVLQHNLNAWDERVRSGKWYVDTATAEDFLRPLQVIDPRGWLGGDITGKRVLCLAAGGGRHGVLLAAAGARVTVVDVSPAMLALDRKLAQERGLELALVEASMDDLSALAEASFQIVIQPVSTCYLPDVVQVYHQVARAIVPGGIYISAHKQPASLQTTFQEAASTHPYVLTHPYYDKGPLPPAPAESWHREAGTLEFLHRWEELIGGLCRAGFVIEDLIEPRHGNSSEPPGSFGHRSCFVPPFVTLKARRTVAPTASPPETRIWLPSS